jgi:hypothetical protein
MHLILSLYCPGAKQSEKSGSKGTINTGDLRCQSREGIIR